MCQNVRQVPSTRPGVQVCILTYVRLDVLPERSSAHDQVAVVLSGCSLGRLLRGGVRFCLVACSCLPSTELLHST